jgi:hypothetical protein
LVQEQLNSSSSDSPEVLLKYKIGDIVEVDYEANMINDHYLLLRYEGNHLKSPNRETWTCINLCDASINVINFFTDEDKVVA